MLAIDSSMTLLSAAFPQLSTNTLTGTGSPLLMVAQPPERSFGRTLYHIMLVWRPAKRALSI